MTLCQIFWVLWKLASTSWEHSSTGPSAGEGNLFCLRCRHLSFALPHLLQVTQREQDDFARFTIIRLGKVNLFGHQGAGLCRFDEMTSLEPHRKLPPRCIHKGGEWEALLLPEDEIRQVHQGKNIDTHFAQGSHAGGVREHLVKFSSRDAAIAVLQNLAWLKRSVLETGSHWIGGIQTSSITNKFESSHIACRIRVASLDWVNLNGVPTTTILLFICYTLLYISRHSYQVPFLCQAVKSRVQFKRLTSSYRNSIPSSLFCSIWTLQETSSACASSRSCLSNDFTSCNWVLTNVEHALTGWSVRGVRNF